VRDTVREGFVPTLESNYKIWPAAQLVNFYLVPLRFRVVFSNAVGLVFNVILSGIYSSASSSSSPAASSVSAPSPPALPPASRKD
jgi:protein Mpv17